MIVTDGPIPKFSSCPNFKSTYRRHLNSNKQMLKAVSGVATHSEDAGAKCPRYALVVDKWNYCNKSYQFILNIIDAKFHSHGRDDHNGTKMQALRSQEVTNKLQKALPRKVNGRDNHSTKHVTTLRWKLFKFAQNMPLGLTNTMVKEFLKSNNRIQCYNGLKWVKDGLTERR